MKISISLSTPANVQAYTNLLYKIRNEVREIVVFYDMRTRLWSKHVPENSNHWCMTSPTRCRSSGYLLNRKIFYNSFIVCKEGDRWLIRLLIKIVKPTIQKRMQENKKSWKDKPCGKVHRIRFELKEWLKNGNFVGWNRKTDLGRIKS